MRKMLCIVVMAALGASLAVGCNTVRGMGRDIEQAGENLQRVGR